MMNAWLRIEGGPHGCAINLIGAAGAAPSSLPDGLTLPVLAAISAVQRPLSVPGIASAPASNLDARVDNAGGARRCGVPPACGWTRR